MYIHTHVYTAARRVTDYDDGWKREGTGTRRRTRRKETKNNCRVVLGLTSWQTFGITIPILNIQSASFGCFPFYTHTYIIFIYTFVRIDSGDGRKIYYTGAYSYRYNISFLPIYFIRFYKISLAVRIIVIIIIVLY